MPLKARKLTAEGAALLELVWAIPATYFRLETEGARLMGEGGMTAGRLAVLRTLAEVGPRTVPQIARSRPVTRQTIQRSANWLLSQGFVEYAANPDHRRSKLLRMTKAGEKEYAKRRNQLVAYCNQLGGTGPGRRAIENAARVLAWLRESAESLEGER